MVALGCTAAHDLGAQSDSAARAPTIVLRADVSAREVRFTKQPEIRVTLVGGTLDSVRVIERRNLPERVVPGTTYRDVYIAVEVIGKLHAECLSAALTGRELPRCRMASGAVEGRSGSRDTTRTPR